jgi:hypothetical protein
MSAPTLPVVRCGIPLTRMVMGGSPSVVNECREEIGDLPALAVPDALWADAEFRAACTDRQREKIRAWTFEDERRGPCPNLFDAIHAELRARDGVPEADCGNPAGGRL